MAIPSKDEKIICYIVLTKVKTLILLILVLILIATNISISSTLSQAKYFKKNSKKVI